MNYKLCIYYKGQHSAWRESPFFYLRQSQLVPLKYLLGNYFCCRLGRNIGKFPWIYIFVSVLICGLLGLGMLDMITTTDPAKLWVPVGSNLISRKLWVEETFIKNTRRATVLAATDNILTPSGIKDVSELSYEM